MKPTATRATPAPPTSSCGHVRKTPNVTQSSIHAGIGFRLHPLNPSYGLLRAALLGDRVQALTQIVDVTRKVVQAR